jgi:hypothetical protein
VGRHLALDVDDTLLGGPESLLRPHLADLFAFAATRFESVSLLTMSRESECRSKLGDLYAYVTRHIYAFPRPENGFAYKKDLRWVHPDVSRVFMIEDPLGKDLNVDWSAQGDRYVLVPAFAWERPHEDRALLDAIGELERRLALEDGSGSPPG